MTKSAFEEKLEQLFGDKFSQGNIWQIPVPEEIYNKTFDKLFTFLLERYDLVALGMYRLPGASDNKYPFVSTNPQPMTGITMHDRVFVLGKKIPPDLIADYAKDDDAIVFSKQQNSRARHMDVDGDQLNLKGSKGHEVDFYGTKKNFPGMQSYQDLTAINEQDNYQSPANFFT